MKVAILGAGPAGLSCANAALTFGLEPVVIERSDHLGGAQRVNFHPNLWLLGTPGESGAELTERMARHFETLSIPTLRRTELQDVQGQGAGFKLSLRGASGDSELIAGALVLATGTRPYATPELVALARQSERVILGPLSLAIRDRIRESRVLVLGGGDNALDHALYLAERGNRVDVCTRGRFSARPQFHAACEDCPEIRLLSDCRPEGLEADGTGVTRVGRDGQQGYDWLLVMYGYRPNTEVLGCFTPDIRPELDAAGFIAVDRWQRTSVPGLYAAGDLTFSPQPSVAVAIAQGLAAARAIERQGHEELRSS